MALAIFDLDETLISGDSDHEWGAFICGKGLAPRAAYEAENDRYFRDYKAGHLDIVAYLRFVLAPLKGMDAGQLKPLQDEFVRERIAPMLLPKAQALLEKHRSQGDSLLIISATNRIITEPIAKRLGVAELIASDVEWKDGRLTGEPLGTPAYREGKVVKLEAWLHEKGLDLKGSSFYSDSRNDLPLLEKVSRPVAVDADEVLSRAARERGWQQLSLR